MLFASSHELEVHYARYHAHVCEAEHCGAVFPNERLFELVSFLYFLAVCAVLVNLVLNSRPSIKLNAMTRSQPCAESAVKKLYVHRGSRVL